MIKKGSNKVKQRGGIRCPFSTISYHEETGIWEKGGGGLGKRILKTAASGGG